MIRGGISKIVFFDSSKKYAESEKVSETKKFLFLFRTFEKKKLSHFIDFVDFKLKNRFFGGVFFPPPYDFSK